MHRGPFAWCAGRRASFGKRGDQRLARRQLREGHERSKRLVDLPPVAPTATVLDHDTPVRGAASQLP